MPSLAVLATATLGLAHVAAVSFQPRGLLAIRQQQNPTTDTDGDTPNIAGLIPAECQQQCSAFAGIAQECLSASNPEQCTCRKEVMDAFLSCVPCFPAIAYDAAFADGPVSVKDYVQASLDQCAASGYPIQGIDVNTLPTSSISVSVETIPPESRTDITYSSGSTTLPAPVTRASSSASGAGASASSGASSVASSVNSAAAGTGTALSSAASSAAASATDAAGGAAAFAKVSGSAFALAVVAAIAMAL